MIRLMLALAVSTLLIAVPAAAQDPPMTSPTPMERSDSFGWGTRLVNQCGQPFTTFVVPDGQYDCEQNDAGVWAIYRSDQAEFICDDNPAWCAPLVCSPRGAATIADDDPALALFPDEPTLSDRKVALAIERTNSCD